MPAASRGGPGDTARRGAPGASPAGPTVAAALLDVLALEGVEHVFGVPGGALLAILAELKARPSITYHLCRHETAAAYAADGYHRVTGKLGVLLVTSGPGATNALTGALNADASGSPLLVVTGEVSTPTYGRGYLQEGVDARLDVAGAYRDALAYSEIVGAPSDFLELLTTALRVAWSSPHRGVHLSIPDDIAASPLAGPPLPTSPAGYRPRARILDRGGVTGAAEVVTAARRPLLMLGERCRRPLADAGRSARLTRAVEHLALPVVTSPDAKGIFPERHPLSLRTVGLAACEWPKYWLRSPAGERIDALVVMGSDLGSLATGNWSPLLEPPGGIVQVHDDVTTLGRAYPLRLGVVSDLAEAIDWFVAEVEAAPVDEAAADVRRREVADIKRRYSPFADPGARSSDADPVEPQALARLVNGYLGDGDHLFVDAGNCVGWCLHYLEVDPPASVHLALAMGPMGFGMGSVVGAKLGAPEARCLAMVGDGAFMMHLGEVATAAQYGLGVIWIVLADHDLAMVSQGMAHFTGDPGFDRYYALAWADLAGAARGLGAQAYDARSTGDVASALEAAAEGAAGGRPQVVSVAIDTAQAPPYYPPSYPPASPG